MALTGGPRPDWPERLWIEGTYQVLPGGSRWPRRHPIALFFGEPITITPEKIDQWQREGDDPHEAAVSLVRDGVLRLAQGHTA